MQNNYATNVLNSQVVPAEGQDSLFSQNSAPDGGSGAGPGGKKQKDSIIKRLSKRARAIKLSGGYLDYMHYYFSEASIENFTEFSIEDKIHYSKYCQHTWVQEVKGDDTRFRGIGCGDRHFCPLCGSYSQIVYSRESARQIELILEAIDVTLSCSVEYESYGLKIVLTVPKTESERIDNLLFFSKYGEWKKEVNALYALGLKWVKKHFPGVPGNMSMDFTGESEPTEPHYHLNIYLLPAKLDKEAHAEAIQHYFNKQELEAFRHSWRDMLNEAYNLELPEANDSVRYIGKVASLYHWLRYQYRHPLSDLWRGWRGYDVESGTLDYSYKDDKGVIQHLTLTNEQLIKAFQRVELIPKHFKRIRWFGALSDGNRGKTLSALGLEKRERAEGDDGESDNWRVEAYFSFVKYEKDGILLELRDDGQNTGQYLKVLDKSVNYSPKGVKVGRRIVWIEPGGQ